MAQPPVTRTRILFGLLLAFAGTLFALLLAPPLRPVEDRITALRRHLAPAPSADSGLVLVYLDNEAIASVGWPVRRNFHALMIRALADLKVRAVGCEILFETPSPEYPEYDDLLAGMTAAAGNIVLGSYVGTVVEESGPDHTAPARAKDLRMPGVFGVRRFGTELHMPFPALRAAAAGIGHLNVGEEGGVPLFISAGGGVLPAFGLEVLRVAAGVPRAAVRFTGASLSLPWEGGEMTIPVSPDQEAGVLPDLRPGVMPTYPFLEVLRSYDALRSGGTPSVPVDRFRGSIVLVGVIAEGRSTFLETPAGPRIPSLLLHAGFVENAVHGRLLTHLPWWITALLILLVAAACAFAVLFMDAPLRHIVIWGVPILAVVTSFLLFAALTVLLPVVPVLVAALAASAGALVLQHRSVRRRMDALQVEKDDIAARLVDHETKLAVLERELVDATAARAADRSSELMEEIRKYKSEIRMLASQRDDMEPFEAERTETGEFEDLLFDPKGKMAVVVEFVRKIASSDAPVLILGESGTGKELVARALHRRSGRVAQPFVPVNCGALAETLLESELFGHEKGAFTGAVKERAGRFERADGGTVFLDEIGEVSENFQLKLLRVLQEGQFERVGGTETIRVNVRVVAATNRDLRALVKAGKYREDLYYRLNVLSVELPPLRERQEDVPLLAERFLRREGDDLRLSRNVMEALAGHHWPGNVRELESVVRRAALLARADRRTMVTVQDLTEEVSAAFRGAAGLEDQVLDAVRGRGFSRSAVTETAAELGGLNRGTVAEHLRGKFLQSFADRGFAVEETVVAMALSTDAEVRDRVRKRLLEYLGNIAEGVEAGRPWEEVRSSLRPKMKNLPRKYHSCLEQVAEGYYRGLWQIPKAEG